jgi:hypothetical protein
MTHPCAVSWCAALATKTFGYCVVHEKNQALHPELTRRQMNQRIVFQKQFEQPAVGRESGETDDAPTTHREE